VVTFSLVLASCSLVSNRYGSVSFDYFPGRDPGGLKSEASQAYFHYIASEKWREQANFTEAIYEAKRAIGVDSRSPYLQSYLATLYLEAGRIDNAFDLAKEVAEEYPSYLEGRLLLGRLCFALGDEKGAMANYEAALKLAPSNREALVSLSRLHAKLGHLNQARRLLKGVPEWRMMALPGEGQQSSLR
jgi:tetratricopeptide (TPR) repeat protein